MPSRSQTAGTVGAGLSASAHVRSECSCILCASWWAFLRARSAVYKPGKFRARTPGLEKPSLPASWPAVGGGCSRSAAFMTSPFAFISAFFSCAIFRPMDRQRSGNSSLMQPAFEYPCCTAIPVIETGRSCASELSSMRFILGRSHFRGAREARGGNARRTSATWNALLAVCRLTTLGQKTAAPLPTVAANRKGASEPAHRHPGLRCTD